jgi:hypothetical protein
VRLNRIFTTESGRIISDEILVVSDASLIATIFQGNAQEVSILTTEGDRVVWRRTE